MITLRNEIKDGDLISNYSDDELIFKELSSKCCLLQTQKAEMIKTKQNLMLLNEEYENVSKRLLRIKSDCDDYKSHLYKTLHNLRLTTDKQRILSRKKLDGFLKKRTEFEEYHKVSPFKCKLEDLVSGNNKLEKECQIRTDLLNLTKKQNDELVNFLMEIFKKKVCEFSEAVLNLKGGQH